MPGQSVVADENFAFLSSVEVLVPDTGKRDDGEKTKKVRD